MPEYLLELYVAREDEQRASDAGESARVVADELSRRGSAISFCWSIFLPDEETCFVLFEAGSAEVVRNAAVLAKLSPERVSAVRTRSTEPTPHVDTAAGSGARNPVMCRPFPGPAQANPP